MRRQGRGWVSFVAIIVLFIVTVQGFVNSPKIITKNGNLIFEAGFNRNISFRLTGKSRLNINDEYDLMDLLLLVTSKNRTVGPQDEWSTAREDASLRQLAADLDDVRRRAFGRNGLDTRLRNLQNSTRMNNPMQRRFQSRLRGLELKVTRITAQLELNSCQSSPCENGASCINTFNGYACKCTAGFEGTKCDRDANECALYEGTDLGCQNGAQCVNQFGTFSCLCQPGWYGVHCTQRKGDCMQASTWELCGHGTCVSSNDTFGYKCLCEPGWKSNGLTPACTVDVDECAAELHTHCSTKCINLPGSFTCAPCAAGLTGNGVACQDLDECALNNGGCSLSPRVACINTYGSYRCGDCPVGWFGDGHSCTRTSTATDNGSGGRGPSNADSALLGRSCAQASSICHPLAICTEISNTVVCSCPEGMVGSGIGLNGCIRGTANNCNSLPCLNGGTCYDTGANYTCLCPMGYRPPICQPLASPCQPNPCQNGARCRPIGGTQFVCQCTPGYKDRLCNTRFSRCGGMLVADTGRLQYPPDGTGYEHNAQCAWVIRTNETQVLNVTFNAFELEDATECRFDWLQINDGRTAASQFIGRFCGRHKPQGGNIISSTNELYLWFRSDNSTSKEGFDLVWNSIAPQCGGVLDVTTHGTIATPGSPGNYPKNRDCRWQLRAANNKRIKLTFFSLQIENHDSCNYDYVEIIDSILGRSLNKFCNSTNPAPLLLFTNEALVHFHSDSDGTDTGFQIHYSIEERMPGCGGTYTAKEGTIDSPTTSGGQQLSCEYDIRMAVGESITIDFIDFTMAIDDCVELYDVDLERGGTRDLQMKYCGGFGDKPPLFNSLYNAVQIKFHSSGNSRFSLKYQMECSYTFGNSSGLIISPNYPNLTNTERLCKYKILTEPNTLIALTTLDFELNDSSLTDDDGDDGCAYTYLWINDGINQNIHGPFCKNSTPPTEFVSKTNMLLMNFKVASTSSGRGFKFEYKSVPIGESGCGGVYTKPGQSIRLPTNDDGVYANDLTCNWIIMAPNKKGILLNWKSFDLEDSTDCTYDYLEIYDTFAANDNVKPLGRYCNSRRPTNFMTHSRQLTLKFVSDYGDAAEGFEVNFDFVDQAQCGGEIHASTGRLTTPEFPLNYTNGNDCRWVIAGPIDSKIELQVEMFELENTVGCTGDWLEVRNGGQNISTVIGRFCGTNIPRRIPSFTNELSLDFHSDSFVNARGFRISWRVYANGCGGRVNAESGVITSPQYPNPYPNDAQCEWHVIVHKGSAIHFTIEDLSMEDLFECYYDYLEFYEGTRTSNSPLTRVCDLPDSKPLHIATERNEATIVFRTDTTSTDRGFRMSFYANCTRTMTDASGAIESLNYGELNYERPLNCSWTIRAPKGNRIVLEFTHFERMPTESHSKEALFLIETLPDGSHVTHTFTEPNNFETIHRLTVVHNTSAISFRLEYKMDGCMFVFHRDVGQLQTPNYPKMYANDMECLWQITTEPGKGIELTVDDLDIEASANCTNDALIISSHPIEYNSHERHCGIMSKLIITSSSHKMFVRFISDHSINGKGFNASYRTLPSPCGGVISAKNGVIQSPNYPQPYPQNADCEWNIYVTDHHAIVFDIEELEIETGYACNWDYLEVKDVYDTIDGEVTTTNSDELFKICGSEPESTHWQTTSNVATVHFASDDSNQSKGFKMRFREACGERVTIDETIFKFFEFSRHTPVNETCVWHLIASDPNKHIIFTPTHVNMHPSAAALYPTEGDCLQHGIKIFDGAEDVGNPKLKFCKSHPPAIISKSNALTITVDVNTIMDFEANYMTMDTMCGSAYNAISGKFTTPYYPDSYPVNLECIWYIEASAGNSVALTFESMDMEVSDDCNNDYVEVHENDERGLLLGVFCGNRLPPAIKGKQSLWIKFRSNDDIVGEGFMASYNYEQHNEIDGTNGTIQSPHYPSKVHTTEPYSWRITVDKEYVVLLTIKHIIDVDMPYIKFYDGYSDIGAEIDYASTNVVRSNTHILFFKALRGPFEFEWERLSKEVVRTNQTADELAKVCGKQLITINSTVVFSSPGYPHGYADNMDCSWLFVPANPAVHAVLQFARIDIERFSECFADFVRVSASKDLQTWQQLDKLCEKPNGTVPTSYKGTPYLKLDFVTDSGVNKTGFSSYVHTECGSELTERRGLVNISTLVTRASPTDCTWTIRARPGRRIRITFVESFFIDPEESTSQLTFCRSFFMVRNGFAEDSPFLGKGKYCDSNITDVLETTSNHAYIRFKYATFFKYRATFLYEEISNDCSDVIVLTEDTSGGSSATIKTPNHPNIPNPHSECVWKITAPAHHTISVSFSGQFDLSPGSGPLTEICEHEYVQINDGNTELMAMLGRFCGKQKPDTIYSSSNALRLKYFNDVPEPRLGFVATVTIGRCGGAYYSDEGTISTPQLIKLPDDARAFECVYTIEVEKGSTIDLKFEKVELPDGNNCSEVQHLELQEIGAFSDDDEERITDTVLICGTEPKHYTVETNKIHIRYKMLGQAHPAGNGFKAIYKAIGARCGEEIIAQRGILQTPSYPAGVRTPTHCVWYLKVAKGRRIKVEVLDFDMGGNVSAPARTFRGGITFSNDQKMSSIIGRYSENPPSAIYSTDNVMGIDVFLLPFNRHRGIKMRFSEDGPSECFYTNLGTGKFQFKQVNNSAMHCTYDLSVPEHETLTMDVTKYERSGLMTNVYVCGALSPLKLMLHGQQLLPSLLCNPNETIPTVRLPFSTQLKVSIRKRSVVGELEVSFNSYKCGGVRQLDLGDNMTIMQPPMADDFGAGPLDCAWAIWPHDFNDGSIDELADWMEGVQIEIDLNVNFLGNCSDHYLLLYNGPDQNSPHLGRFCSQASATNLVVERGLFFEYHTATYERNSTFNLTLKHGSGCGGKLTYPYRKIVFSEQYKNNVECVWDIETDSGFNIGLAFEGRFFIESSPNCTKDYLKVQQKALVGDAWSDLQTICGREPPVSVNTTTAAMRLIFRSDSAITADGFTAKLQRNCGGIMFATKEPAQLASPGYPDRYPNNLLCSYTIKPLDGGSAGVLVRFINFDLELTPSIKCIFDNVTVRTTDDDDTVHESILCGVKTNHEYRAKKAITIVFRTDMSFAAKGFLIEYSTNVCGGVITQSALIESPRQHTDSKFPPRSNCYWNLTAPAGSKIVIKFEQIDFENQHLCVFDAVEVYQGLAPLEHERLAKLCGNLTGRLPTISIPTHLGLIHSFSDERDGSVGFRALVSYLPNCDMKIVLNAQNSPYTFDKYAGSYNNNLDCTYEFKTDASHQLQIEFNSFHLELSNNCENDYVEIRDGAGSFAELIGRFCGHDMPTKLVSSRNALYVRIVSDGSVTDTGFAAVLNMIPLACGVHGIHLDNKTTIYTLSSPSVADSNAPNTFSCFWKIVATKPIHLHFTLLDLPPPDASGNCGSNYLRIYNKEDAALIEKGYGSDVVFNGQTSSPEYKSAATQNVYCGHGLPDDYYANSKAVYVRYRAENSTSAGFTLKASQAEGCFRNFTAHQGRIRIAETIDHCDIYIKVTANYTLSLYYDVSIFSSYECDLEYIEVFDMHTNKSLQKLCSYTDNGRSLFTVTNWLRLRIKSMGEYTEQDITYLASRNGPGCGGDLYNTEGLITNPYYPQNVRNNSDCRWNIRVPANNHVLLRFEEFNLGVKSTCISDYLQIIERSDVDGTEHVVRQFCGEDTPKVYQSSRSSLTVRFHKTVNYDGTGWVIKFLGVYANDDQSSFFQRPADLRLF